MELTKDLAFQFAVMINSGMPPAHAILYFMEEADQTELRVTLKTWLGSPFVRSALRTLQGKSWQDMSLDEKVKFAVEKNYAEAAYYLYSTNYAELTGADRSKADMCRQVLEVRIAGMSGKTDVLTQWFEDVKSGKVRLGAATSSGIIPPLPPH